MHRPVLRHYQELSKAELGAAWKQGQRCVILVIPTGGGKTTIAADMIENIIKNGKTVLVLVHRKELVEQFVARLIAFGLSPGIIMAGVKFIIRPVMVASVQTLARRPRHMPSADVIFVDECHHSVSNGFKNILKQYPNAFVIGLTATPYRLDGKGLHDLYSKIVAPVSVSNLIDWGHLVPAKYYGPEQDLSDVGTVGGDYNPKELFNKFNKQPLYDDMIKHYLRFAGGTKAIVFNINVEHSQKTRDMFLTAGITCAHLDGETPAPTRTRILQEFKTGKYQVLCNVNILTEGFDLPTIETVILNRATKSKSLYFQMVGRGLRPAPGKSHCTVIDQGGNVYMHGPVDLEEEYNLNPKKKKKKAGAPPMKECPKCYLIQFAGARACKECGHPFTVDAPVDLQKAEFKDITEHVATMKPKIPLHLRKKWSEMSETELQEFARFKGYKTGWVTRQLIIQQQKNAA